MSQGSVYGERIAKFLKDNPVVNLFSHYKIKYDESDNLVIRGVRTVTENIGELFRSSFSQTEMVKVEFYLIKWLFKINSDKTYFG